MEELTRLIRRAADRYRRLAMIVGEPGTGKTRLLQRFSAVHGVPRMNVGLELSRALLEEPGEERAVRALETFPRLIPGDVPTVALDHIEALFSPALKLDVLELLKQAAASRILLVAWPGRLERGELQYAAPSHPEHFTAEWPGPTLDLNDR